MRRILYNEKITRRKLTQRTKFETANQQYTNNECHVVDKY